MPALLWSRPGGISAPSCVRAITNPFRTDCLRATMGLRLRSVRQRILLLVLVPVLSLIGLYAYSTAVFSTQAINLARTLVLKNSTAQPAGNFYGAVGTERPLPWCTWPGPPRMR